MRLPNNYIVAKERLNGLRKRFARDPEFFEKYSTIIEGYVRKGHAQLVPDVQLKMGFEPKWYLPHHVLKTLKSLAS